MVRSGCGLLCCFGGHCSLRGSLYCSDAVWPSTRTRRSGETIQGIPGTDWTIRAGATAPQAAGVIHTDFERGFIRAETIAYADYVALGGEAKAREAGKLRAEGKTYKVADGDVLHFLFNT